MSACVESAGEVQFLSRVAALPIVAFTLDTAAGVYKETKEKNNYINAALTLAEGGINKVTSTALSHAHAKGLASLDQWACDGLDRVTKAAPIIMKPKEEVLTTARDKIYETISGVDTPQASLTAAISTRASNTACSVGSSKSGQLALSTSDWLLTKAHDAVDSYIPPAPQDQHSEAGSEATLSERSVSLVAKVRQRVTRVAGQYLNTEDQEHFNTEEKPAKQSLFTSAISFLRHTTLHLMAYDVVMNAKNRIMEEGRNRMMKGCAVERVLGYFKEFVSKTWIGSKLLSITSSTETTSPSSTESATVSANSCTTATLNIDTPSATPSTPNFTSAPIPYNPVPSTPATIPSEPIPSTPAIPSEPTPSTPATVLSETTPSTPSNPESCLPSTPSTPCETYSTPSTTASSKKNKKNKKPE